MTSIDTAASPPRRPNPWMGPGAILPALAILVGLAGGYYSATAATGERLAKVETAVGFLVPAIQELNRKLDRLLDRRQASTDNSP